jgi:hypothetical protein
MIVLQITWSPFHPRRFSRLNYVLIRLIIINDRV